MKFVYTPRENFDVFLWKWHKILSHNNQLPLFSAVTVIFTHVTVQSRVQPTTRTTLSVYRVTYQQQHRVSQRHSVSTERRRFIHGPPSRLESIPWFIRLTLHDSLLFVVFISQLVNHIQHRRLPPCVSVLCATNKPDKIDWEIHRHIKLFLTSSI